MANYFSIILTLAVLISGCSQLFVFYYKKRQMLKKKCMKVLENDAFNELTRAQHTSIKLLRAIGTIFPTLALVLIIRSFICEPYRIPSSSMEPTLLPGDFIIAKKYAYGIKDPIFQKQLIATGSPKRGDIVVFKSPEDPKNYFIKRIIALPGEKVIYRGKQLFVQPVLTEKITKPVLRHFSYYRVPVSEGNYSSNVFYEKLDNKKYRILLNSYQDNPLYYYQQVGIPLGEWIVPKGNYFVMGDNRDNSRDSRFWGFVPEKNLIGQATIIWLSIDQKSNNLLAKFRWQRFGSIE